MSKAIRRVGPAIVAVAIVGGFVLAGGSSAGAAKPLATATLTNASGTEIGTVVFKGSGKYAERVEVELDLPDGAPGPGAYHGFHIHKTGLCTTTTATFDDAGAHWNLVTNATHGDHTGDLPSVLVGEDGTAYAEFETHRFDVTDLFDSDGSAVILHELADNFGRVPRADGQYHDHNDFYGNSTAKTGDAGPRYGCGVVQPTI